MIERRRDTADRRVVIVQPAAGGHQLLPELTIEVLQGLLAGHRAHRVAHAACP